MPYGNNADWERFLAQAESEVYLMDDSDIPRGDRDTLVLQLAEQLYQEYFDNRRDDVDVHDRE